MYFIWEKVYGVSEQLSVTPQFLGSKCKNRLFKKKKKVSSVFYRLQTCLVDLNKHQTLEILLRVVFVRIL